MKSKLADDYLNIKAQQAALAEAETKIKQKLLATNQTEFEGNLGRVLITEVEGRITYDSALLKQHVPEATLNLCKKQGEKSLRFTVTARKAKINLSKAA